MCKAKRLNFEYPISNFYYFFQVAGKRAISKNRHPLPDPDPDPEPIKNRTLKLSDP